MSDESGFSTPMMQQYLQLKQEYADCILWFRLGDFYEMFLDHAEIGSKILGITLTRRPRGKDGDIPMAGVPYHAADSYLGKLVAAGYNVAICEQTSQPNGKTLVDRQVVRIVTPGTILDSKNLTDKHNNYLLCLIKQERQLGIAIVDISTGEFRAGTLSGSPSFWEPQLAEIVTLYPPSECIVDQILIQDTASLAILKKYIPVVINSPQVLTKQQPLFSQQKHFIHFDQMALTATAALLTYVEHTQQQKVVHLQPLAPLLPKKYLSMNRSTIRNLELFSELTSQSRQGSLISILDKTQTALGGRLLKAWLLKPLSHKPDIQQRLDLVDYLVHQPTLRSQLRGQLNHVFDLERLIARLSVGLGSPKDLKSIVTSLDIILTIDSLLNQSPLKHTLFRATKGRSVIQHLLAMLEQTLTEDPPFDPKNGQVIKQGFHPQLDKLRASITQSQHIIAKLEASERTKTGITSLKIKYNQIFGYYIEVSKTNLSSVPKTYFRKQTLVNAERFVTEELKEQEEIILHAQEKASELELVLFKDTIQQVLAKTKPLQLLAHQVATLDCLQALAETAYLNDYVKPKLVNTGQINLVESRHPVVEQLVAQHQFVPNSLHLNQTSDQVMLLSGPNMAGKSVLMRQVALITLMAHVGSFVPAKKATISLTDQIFVRSGAADMIGLGLSTFMVEMVETAQILKQATDKSLIIMDEIGRGTSTYDGISIAWAIAEQLVKKDKKGPKTLFATHYHELQSLANTYPKRIRNYHMKVTEYQGKPIFLYTLTHGGASHSFGVAVAELADIPPAVIRRARQLLASIEHHPSFQLNSSVLKTSSNLPTPALKSPGGVIQPTNTDQALAPEVAQVVDELQAFSIEKATPLATLNQVADWQKRLKHG